MSTETGVKDDRESKLLRLEERAEPYCWLPGVISAVEERTINGSMSLLVTVSALTTDGVQEFEHVPPRNIFEGMARYYNVAFPSGPIGRAVWLLLRYGRAYKIFGARELEVSHTTDGGAMR